MKTIYEVLLEGVLPVIAKIQIEANSESEATMLASQIAECQRDGVKTRAFEVEMYPADYLMVEGVSEITVVDLDDEDGKVWNRGDIEELLGATGA